MLRGWHAHNGVSLNNPNLGFVCTQTTVDGAPGLEGYYLEYEHALEPDQRLRFAPDESCPRIDPITLPELDFDSWPALRRAKAYRNYAIEYIRNGLPLILELLGPDEGRALGQLCGMQVGMQCYDDVIQRLKITGNDPCKFLDMLEFLLCASGDKVTRKSNVLERDVWRLFAETDQQSAITEIWCAPFMGLLSVHDRFLQLDHDDNDQFSINERPQ